MVNKLQIKMIIKTKSITDNKCVKTPSKIVNEKTTNISHYKLTCPQTSPPMPNSRQYIHCSTVNGSVENAKPPNCTSRICKTPISLHWLCLSVHKDKSTSQVIFHVIYFNRQLSCNIVYQHAAYTDGISLCSDWSDN